MARNLLREREREREREKEREMPLVTVVPRAELAQARAQALRLADYGVMLLVFSDSEAAARFLASRLPAK
jgi:hypothetical protein